MPVLTGVVPSSACNAPNVTVETGAGGGPPGNSTWAFCTAMAVRMPCPAVRAARGSLVAAMRRSGESSIAGGTALAATSARCVVPGAAAMRASAGAIVTSAEAAVSGSIIRLRNRDAARSARRAPWCSRLARSMSPAWRQASSTSASWWSRTIAAPSPAAARRRGSRLSRRDHPAVTSVEPLAVLPYTGSPTTGAPPLRSSSPVNVIAAASAAVGAQASMASTGCSAPSSGATRPSTSPVTEPASSASGRLAADRSRAVRRRASVSRSPRSVVVNAHESYTGSVTPAAAQAGAALRGSGTSWPSPARRPASNVGTRQAR